VSQQAHNMMSVLRAWLLTDLADPPEAVVDTYFTLAPPWQLGRADEHGHISLRRTLAGHVTGAATHSKRQRSARCVATSAPDSNESGDELRAARSACNVGRPRQHVVVRNARATPGTSVSRRRRRSPSTSPVRRSRVRFDVIVGSWLSSVPST
jgi:hypothetical protein